MNKSQLKAFVAGIVVLLVGLMFLPTHARYERGSGQQVFYIDVSTPREVQVGFVLLVIAGTGSVMYHFRNSKPVTSA